MMKLRIPRWHLERCVICGRLFKALGDQVTDSLACADRWRARRS